MYRKYACILLFSAGVASMALGQEPVTTTTCQLQAIPFAYDHKIVRVAGFISHDFEDFTLFDPFCPTYSNVWLDYGGKVNSETMYCCGVTADRTRPKELVIEGIPVPLTINKQFEDFDRAIQGPFRSGQYGALIRATLVGRFFAGERMALFGGKRWGGFGHMGCCTLLAIQRVEDVDTVNRPGLDYGASADQPDVGKAGCGYSFLLPLRDEVFSALLDWQREAEQGDRPWAFDDPKRVASDALSRLAKIDTSSLASVNLSRQGPGRNVYVLRPKRSHASYMVVVSRPYWLSFHAKDANRVAWATIAAYESSCEGAHSVTRME